MADTACKQTIKNLASSNVTIIVVAIVLVVLYIWYTNRDTSVKQVQSAPSQNEKLTDLDMEKKAILDLVDSINRKQG